MQNRRYHRQILLNKIGEKGQERLAQSSALLVGAGGLGSVVAPLLVGGGIGSLAIFDDDTSQTNTISPTKTLLFMHTHTLFIILCI